MIQILAAFGRSYAPYVMLPCSIVIGAIGYKMEWWLRGDSETPWKKESISDERARRQVKENSDDFESLKNPTFIPETIFRDK